MPTVHDVADYLLWLADRDRIGVDHLKLQKLVYYAQAFHLGSTGEPLFNEEIRAWRYGPVCPDLWQRHRYRRDYLEPPESPNDAAFTEREQDLLTLVHHRFRELSGIELFHRTHAEAPWQGADTRAASGGSDLIDQESMRDYFAGRLWVLVENGEAPAPPSVEWVVQFPEATTDGVAERRPEVFIPSTR
jgi:uncharacterized phage-associated protein